jgi:hypothetical protein
VDEALTRFDRSGDFASIVSSQRDKWDSRVETEIDLSDVTIHLSMEQARSQRTPPDHEGREYR